MDAKRGHGGHGPGQSAGNDVLKIAQVCSDVERESVRCHPAAEVHADGGDLAITGPNAGELGNASGFDAVIGEGIDDGLLEGADVGAHVALPIAEVEDGVADELPGTVIGDVAAAVGGEEFDAGAVEDFGGGEEV